MEYTIIVKENETGKELINDQCNAIIGGYAKDADICVMLGVTECNGKQLLAACESAIDSVLEVTKDTPPLRALIGLKILDTLNKITKG